MPKLFLCALFLCLFLATGGLAQTSNSSNLLKQLLDLPAPAPENPFYETGPAKIERPTEFFLDENVPSDSAPIEDLIDYWTKKALNYKADRYHIDPTEKTLERILEYCEDHPEESVRLLALLPPKPAYAEKVKQIYDRALQTGDENSYLKNSLHGWLKNNSKYYLDELIKQARRVSDGETYISSEGREELFALARVDWDSARPIVERLESGAAQPFSATLAKWIIYRHAIETGDTSTAERYRSELKRIVEDKKAPVGQRDLAMDALVLNGDWEGRADWYLSLYEDETMLGLQDAGYTGLSTLTMMSPPETWTDGMIKLTKSPNLAVRSAAVRNLIEDFQSDRRDVLEALLPWLFNPDWVKSRNNSQRMTLIAGYAEADFPEAVPGLISIVQNEKGLMRAQAAKALAKYKDASAIPALRFALHDEQFLEALESVIEALIACGGISDDEQMSSLEAFATLASTPGGLAEMDSYQYRRYQSDDEAAKALPVTIIIGKVLKEQEEPGEGLAARAIAREKLLRKTKPAVATVLAEIIRKWTGRVVYLELARRIRSNEADADTILTFLANRKSLREKIPNEINSMRATNGLTRGIGACVAEDAGEYLSILGQTDQETQIAMFSCARLIRAGLPVREVGELLKSQNNLLALAAERYLETEDSVEARKLILAKHPNEALILGAKQSFVPAEVKSAAASAALVQLFQSVAGYYVESGNFPEIKTFEESLRAEIKENAEMLAIYAFLPEEKSGQQVVRVYKNRIALTFYEDTARYYQRDLTPDEYEQLYRFLLENNIDGFPPFNGGACGECPSSEFLMFGRNGGRRVFFRTSFINQPAVIKLRELFASFQTSEMKLHYKLADKIKNLEVLLADANFNALAVWKKDGDLRVLVEDEAKKAEIQKNLDELEKAEQAASDDESAEEAQARYQMRFLRRSEAEYAHYFWRRVENGKLGAVSTQPAEAMFLPDAAPSVPFNRSYERNQPTRSWQVRSGNFEIRTGNFDDRDDDSAAGIYKIRRGQNAVPIKEGLFTQPITSLDGKWAVVSSTTGDWREPNGISRINLETGKEFKVNLPPANLFAPLTRTASQNKILLLRARGRLYDDGDSMQYNNEDASDTDAKKPNPSPKVPEYYLIDPVTGAVELVKGDFRPLQQQTYRPLQPTANPGEFWAAVYDEKTKSTAIGRYSEKTFSLQPILTVPDINLNSMQIWVDEKEAKVYFVYEGHLLALPLN